MQYIREVLRKNRKTAVLFILSGIFNSLLLNYKAVCFQQVIDHLTQGSLLLSKITGYGFVLIVHYCMNYAGEYPGTKLGHDVFWDFRLMALRKISRIDYQEYQKLGTGKLVQQIETGAAAGRDVIGFWTTLLRGLIPTIFFSILFIYRVSPDITWILLAGYVFVFLSTNVLLRFLYRIKERILDHEELLNHLLVRGLMEMPVFRMAVRFSPEIQKADDAKGDIVSSKVKMTMIHEAFFAIFAVLVALLDISILIYAWKSRTLSAGSVVALLSLIENAYEPVAVFNVIYVQYRLDHAAFSRFEGFLLQKEDDRLTKGRGPEGVTGEIRIENLSFHYGDRMIFDGLNLSVREGEKVAIVGESGSGKSTLIRLIPGLLKYDSGRILLGDVELKELCLNRLYENIGYLSQDCPVFDGTIRENLVFDREVPEEALWEALRAVRLSGLVEQMEDGCDTRIGERGSILSGGEKQRLALARLWFQDPKFILLDEATSAMDSLTERQVMQELFRRMKDHTVIAVTHRLNDIMNFDRILVFRDGKITAQGSFDVLMAECPYFAGLYQASLKQ